MPIKFAGSVVLFVAALAAVAGQGTSSSDWAVYLGDNARSHYSALTQITKANVTQLKPAWTYDTGDRGEYQSNNLIVRGVLYTATPTRKVIALDAATGKEIWKWDPTTERPGPTGNRQRGLGFWEAANGADARIFTGVGQHLYALDPKTGAIVRSFADNGSLQLGTGGE